MAKYDEHFKLSIVQEYLNGRIGYQTLSNQYGLAKTVVRRWVLQFQAHGTGAFKKKFSHYSPEYKLSVLQFMWQNELSYGQAGIHFDIRNPGILSQWEQDYRTGGITALKSQKRGRPVAMTTSPAKPDLPANDQPHTQAALLDELAYLRMENAYLKKLHALVQARPKQVLPKKRK